MKKVLSVAMASAMVLGMGANAFADLHYNTTSGDAKISLPSSLKFEQPLFVTDKNGKLVKSSLTDLNDYESVDFQPGDTVWMPLSADNQVVYASEIEKGEAAKEAVTVRVNVDSATLGANVKSKNGNTFFYTENGKWYEGPVATAAAAKTAEVTDKADLQKLKAGYIANVDAATGAFNVVDKVTADDANHNDIATLATLEYDGVERKVNSNSIKYYIDATKVSEKEFYATLAQDVTADNHAYYVSYNLLAENGKDLVIGKPLDNEIVEHGLYTGEIGTNWSVNLVEEKTNLLESFVDKAYLYRATTKDYHSYVDTLGDDVISPKAVYVKVELKKEWKNCDTANLKYYTYVADNNGNKTNKVWVAGNYAADVKSVDFTWSNDASVAGVWKANDNGVAVFDFADKAYFTVKMYKGECIYLDMASAYNKAIDDEFDGDIDEFFLFDTENANFNRSGELVLVSDDADKVVYEVADDEIFDMEAEYVENYAVAHTNKRVNGYVFNTADLGKYVLADEIVVEDEEEAEEEDKAEEVKPSEDAKEETVKPNKVNPNTGANDFVGLAVSLAVVSVAAAGALALKK